MAQAIELMSDVAAKGGQESSRPFESEVASQ
jgi:hypothetical protein